MRNSMISIALVCGAVALLAACGSDSDSGGDSGGSSTGTYGTGLELGTEVLKSTPVGRSVEPWLRWNNETCSFEEAKDHPAAYKADVRNVVGGDAKVGYMHYGNTDTFGVANSKNVEEVAELADMPLDVYNLKFPSRTEPLANARTAITKGDQGVMQANLDTTVLPGYYKILEEEGCIPSVQMYIPIEGRPAMGASWPEVGTEIGAFLAKTALERKWDPSETALVQCTDPDNGPTVNIMFETIKEQVVADGFEIPSDNMYDLVCKLSESQSGDKRVTDWFTANPDYKNVMITSGDSPRMQSIIKAVEREGRSKEATLLVDGTLDDADADALRRDKQDMSVAFYPEKYGDWLIPMIQDLMAGNPVPSFVGSKLVQGTPENVDELYPEE